MVDTLTARLTGGHTFIAMPDNAFAIMLCSGDALPPPTQCMGMPGQADALTCCKLAFFS